jgi:hypothetical protein
MAFYGFELRIRALKARDQKSLGQATGRFRLVAQP